MIPPTQDLIVGKPSKIFYQLTNSSLLPIPYLMIGSGKIHSTDYPSKKVLGLSPRSSYEFFIEVTPKRRGYFEVEEKELVVRDIFRLFTFKKKLTTPASLLVYPKLYPLSSFIETGGNDQGENRTANDIFEDRSQINSLREYVEGDQLSSMHWKLSAKRDEPMMKIYDSTVSTKVYLFLDNSIQSLAKDVDHRLEDKMVDLILSLAHYYLEKQIPFVFYYQDANKIMAINSRDLKDMKELLTILAKIEANGTISFEHMVRQHSDKLKDGSMEVLVTTQLNVGQVVPIFDRTYLSELPIIFLVEDRVNYEASEHLVESFLPIYRIDYTDHLKNIMEDSYE